ncbi:hypothetical protein EDB84DRAFT_1485700 [Lactarius hengduanensis]|nr:hypothetical protein EDB84DRAFT_1485700 [Lactarius hengduanensis]
MFSEHRAFDPDTVASDSSLYMDIVMANENTDSDEDGELPSLTDDEIRTIVDKLPRLTESDLENLGHRDSSCSICMNTFLASLAEEEMARAMDSPAQPAEDLGVTRLIDTCGHVFCRKDLLSWIRDGNPSCPLCRTQFIKRQSRRELIHAARRRISAAYRMEHRILNGGSFGGDMYS